MVPPYSDIHGSIFIYRNRVAIMFDIIVDISYGIIVDITIERNHNMIIDTMFDIAMNADIDIDLNILKAMLKMNNRCKNVNHIRIVS